MKQLFKNHPGLLVAVFTLCWAFIELIGAAARVSPYQVVWTRYGVHLAFMLLVFGPRHGVQLVKSRRFGSQVVSSLLMLGMPVSFIVAMQLLRPSDTLTLFWLAPLLVIALCLFTRDEQGNVWTWSAGIAGFVGAVLISHPDAAILHRSAILALGTAMCLALYFIVVRSMRHEPILTKLFHTALWVFAALSLVVPVVWRTPTVRGTIVLVLIGLLGWGALYALDMALELASPALLAPALYTQIVWDELFNWPFRHTQHSTRLLAGFALVLVAALPALFWRARSIQHTHTQHS